MYTIVDTWSLQYLYPASIVHLQQYTCSKFAAVLALQVSKLVAILTFTTNFAHKTSYKTYFKNDGRTTSNLYREKIPVCSAIRIHNFLICFFFVRHSTQLLHGFFCWTLYILLVLVGYYEILNLCNIM